MKSAQCKIDVTYENPPAYVPFVNFKLYTSNNIPGTNTKNNKDIIIISLIDKTDADDTVDEVDVVC